MGEALSQRRFFRETHTHAHEPSGTGCDIKIEIETFAKPQFACANFGNSGWHLGARAPAFCGSFACSLQARACKGIDQKRVQPQHGRPPVFRNAKQIPKRAKQAPAGEPHKNTLRLRPQSRTTTDRRSARSALSDVTYPVTYDLAKAGPLNSADIAMNTKPATETPNQREFLLSQLSPPERQTVESILADYPGLTVAMCIEQLRNAGWL